MRIPIDAAYIKARITEGPTGCWEWGGRIDPISGYGRTSVRQNDRRETYAHRASYRVFKGEITYTIDHLCMNRACCNPDHLRDVPLGVNIMASPNAYAKQLAARTHCKHGHEYTPENTAYQATNGARICLTCKRGWQRKYDEKRRGRAA